MSGVARIVPGCGRALGVSTLLLGLVGCSYDRGDRWQVVPTPEVPVCEEGSTRCTDALLQRCEVGDDGPAWQLVEDCSERGWVCVATEKDCAPCVPGAPFCVDQTVMRCADDGSSFTPERVCDRTGVACRNGGCADLCALAADRRSNVGCEYWAVDLDNANVSESLNAAAQQFAVVVSNPQPDIPADVTVERDDTQPGQANAPLVVAQATLAPLSLQVFRLGPREVDGSPPGTYNTGTHSALSRGGYRITSTVPIIAYQFNPLENLNVFSNDASLLKPVEALSTTPDVLTDSYVVLGWPQTIASSDDPDTNFSETNPIDLRAFLTVVGTRPDTRVRLRTATRIVGTGPRGASSVLAGHGGIPEVPRGGELEAVLQPFDVLNLETGGFDADFTGSVIAADRPVVVFSGSEASDAPMFTTLATRRCCADHLEEQLDPIRTSGREYVATVSPSRTRAVVDAGANLRIVDQPEYFRVIATSPAGATVHTTEPRYPVIELDGFAAFATLESTSHFMLSSDHPIMLESVSPSQEAAGIPRGTPGGDPSSVVVPPIEQFRRNYVFLTPDKYRFDFVRIIAEPAAVIVFDNRALGDLPGCTTAPADGLTEGERGDLPPSWVVHTCQLSFPVFDPETGGMADGIQNDHVHRVESDRPVGVIVNGFDSFVSYAYAGGTELMQIAVE